MRKRYLSLSIIILVLVMIMAFNGCNKNQYKIYFETNGGTPVAPLETDGNSVVNLPRPTKEGYVFEGWYYDNHTFREEFTNSSLKNNPINEDIRVYANWVIDLIPTEGLIYEEKEEGYEITGYTGDSKDVIIAPNHNDLEVIGIASQAFKDKNIESIIISDSIEEIGEGAFKGCENLQSMRLPFVGRKRGLSDSYDSVFGYIFGYTDDFLEGILQTTQYYDSENSLYYYIPSSLQEVEITQTSRIPYGAFYNCNDIKKISIPDSTIRIQEKAFYNCSSLGFLIIYSTTTIIDKDAFLNSPDLTLYCQAEEKPALWSDSFAAEDNIVYWGVDPLDIGDYEGLQYLISDNNIEITRYFGDRENLTIPSTIIDRTVVDIKSNTFKDSDIISVEIPDTVQNIGFSAFKGVNNLNSLTVPFTGKNPNENINTNFGYIFGASSSSLNYNYVPQSLKVVELTTGKTIKDSVFLDCGYIEEIILPSTLEVIESSAFRNCLSLATINFPQSIDVLEDNIFNGCSLLETVVLPNQVSEMGSGIFYNCEGLIDVTLPQNITKIPDNAFYGCEKLEEISLPASVTDIGISAFEGCQSITAISLPENVTKLDSRAFNNCQMLEDINIPDNVNIIGDKVFENCVSLYSITIPYAVTNIGMWAFNNCDNLTIYAERTQRPSGWVDQWNVSDCTVVWAEGD